MTNTEIEKFIKKAKTTKTGLDRANKSLAKESEEKALPPLFWAIENREIEFAKALIEAGAQVNIKFEGQYPLIRALQRYSLEIVELLLEAGADPNIVCQKSRMTPLTCAVSLDYSSELILNLIEHGANIDLKDENNNTALIIAICYSESDSSVPRISLNRLKFLVEECRADVLVKGYTNPLSYACIAYNHLAISSYRSYKGEAEDIDLAYKKAEYIASQIANTSLVFVKNRLEYRERQEVVSDTRLEVKEEQVSGKALELEEHAISQELQEDVQEKQAFRIENFLFPSVAKESLVLGDMDEDVLEEESQEREYNFFS